MFAYVTRRVLMVPLQLFGIMAIFFVVFYIAGGDPAIAKAGGPKASPEAIEAARKELGLDRPLFFDPVALARGEVREGFDSQFVRYIAQTARREFGRTWFTGGERITKLIREGLVPSLLVTVPAYLLSTAIAIYIALFSALYHNRWVDRSLVIVSVILMSVPFLAIIIVAQYGLCYLVGWFPISGYTGGWEALKYVALPVLLGTIVGVGGGARFYRTIMLEEIRQDYVRTAMAKGVERGMVLFKHVLKNAMIPIITNVVVTLPLLYTGSLLLEQFFGIPGLGRMSVNAIESGDRPVLLAMVLVGSFIYVVANLVADVCYAVADPRVRLR